jgi:hypothetical protein
VHSRRRIQRETKRVAPTAHLDVSVKKVASQQCGGSPKSCVCVCVRRGGWVSRQLVYGQRGSGLSLTLQHRGPALPFPSR